MLEGVVLFVRALARRVSIVSTSERTREDEGSIGIFWRDRDGAVSYNVVVLGSGVRTEGPVLPRDIAMIGTIGPVRRDGAPRRHGETRRHGVTARRFTSRPCAFVV